MLELLANNADAIIAVVSAVFAASLLPTVWNQGKERSSTIPLTTSVLTFVGLVVIVAVYASLDLRYAFGVGSGTATLWSVIAIQRWMYGRGVPRWNCSRCSIEFYSAMCSRCSIERAERFDPIRVIGKTVGGVLYADRLAINSRYSFDDLVSFGSLLSAAGMTVEDGYSLLAVIDLAEATEVVVDEVRRQHEEGS